jgi:AraC family transcriptional regulator
MFADPIVVVDGTERWVSLKDRSVSLGSHAVYSMTVRHAPMPDPVRPQTRHLLHESPGVSVIDFRCRADVEPLGPEEPNPTHGIVLVRKGVFRRMQQREMFVADANHVLFFNAGEPYRYSHPLPGGDYCTILAVDTRPALELVAHYAPRDAERPETPFRIGHALSSPRAAQLQYELLGLARRGVSGLALEDVVAELADEAVGAAYRARGVSVKGEWASTKAGRRRRDLVEAAKLAVNERFESPPSLGELARSLGCSPFHLSRTFHTSAGLSLRRYAVRLRTRLAANRLATEQHDLTELALDLGYADHSHFTNAFRKEWGLPPSRFRELQRAAARGSTSSRPARPMPA